MFFKAKFYLVNFFSFMVDIKKALFNVDCFSYQYYEMVCISATITLSVISEINDKSLRITLHALTPSRYTKF